MLLISTQDLSHLTLVKKQSMRCSKRNANHRGKTKKKCYLLLLRFLD